MRLLASLATALFVAQVALCGVRGFGLGAPFGDAPTAAAASCHGAAQPPDDTARDDDDERRRCRAHCELFERGLAAAAPDVDAPACTTLLPAATVALALPAGVPARRARGAVPPTVPRRILHASLLI